MKRNHGYLNACGAASLSLLIIMLALSSPAQAANGCYKHITFKNEAAYIASAGVSYFFNSHNVSQPTGNFPVGQEKRVGVPCAATNVEAYAKAVGGNDILRQGLGNAQDRCFRLKGTTLNPRYESCDPPGTPPVQPSGCYKHITFKNQGGYVAKGSVTYFMNYQSTSQHTGNFPVGQEKRLAVPCDATSVSVEAEAVGGMGIISRYVTHAAEDRCFALKGTTVNPTYEFCSPPGPPYVIDCWKHITLKNEGWYVVDAEVSYMIEKQGLSEHKFVRIGNISRGQEKRVPVPCSSSSYLRASAVLGKFGLMDRISLRANQDYCFVFKGISTSARYSDCSAAEAEQGHSITIRNNGAYATELTVTYSYNNERPTKRAVIQTRHQGGVSIPLQATNIYMKAKAIGGETIFEKNFATAQAMCYEVKGTTLMTRYSGCN